MIRMLASVVPPRPKPCNLNADHMFPSLAKSITNSKAWADQALSHTGLPLVAK